MDTRHVILTIALVSGLAVPASAEVTLVHEGFVTGDKYRSLPAGQRFGYVMGWLDGVFVSPLFGAPGHTQDGTALAALARCVVGMNNPQLDAIFSMNRTGFAGGSNS